MNGLIVFTMDYSRSNMIDNYLIIRYINKN